MATRRIEVFSQATVDAVSQAVRDVGALHTRLVPGFVVDTNSSPAQGWSRSPAALSSASRSSHRRRGKTSRLDSEGGRAHHYNASLQICPPASGKPASSGSPIFCPTRSRH